MATDYGTAIAGIDLPRRWKLISGQRLVAEALIRRWSTDRGRLPYAPDYGTDIRGMLGETLTPSAIAEWSARIGLEAEKEERVSHCAVSISYDAASAAAILTAEVTLSDGQTFALVAAVSELTVDLLRVT